jgi:hypothetical protein
VFCNTYIELLIAGNVGRYGATSIITFSLAIQLAYFCLIDLVRLNLLAAIKSIGNKVAHVPKAPVLPNLFS